MNRLPSAALLLVIGVVMAGRAVAQEDKKAVQPLDKADPAHIRKLVEQLGSANFRTREKAVEELSKLDVIPDALLEAIKKGDLETARRAESIAAKIRTRMEEKAFVALAADLQKVELDRFVRQMVNDEKFRDDTKWDFVRVLAKAVVRKANALGRQEFGVPDLDAKELPFADPMVLRAEIGQKRVLLKESDPGSISFRKCVVLCAGNMPPCMLLDHSIAIVDGDFAEGATVKNSLLIVRGNVRRMHHIDDSIVIATGHIEGNSRCKKSFLQVSNYYIPFVGSRSVFVKTRFRTGDSRTSKVIDTDEGPLQLLKFSSRKNEAELKWGLEADNLAIAVTPADQPGKLLVRWKNVCKGSFAFPLVQFQIYLRDLDAKGMPTREYQAPRSGNFPGSERMIVLGPGKAYEEIVDLWKFADEPENGRYQVSVGVNIRPWRVDFEDYYIWSGKVRSNEIEISVGK
jgi:hypothetical protein